MWKRGVSRALDYSKQEVNADGVVAMGFERLAPFFASPYQGDFVLMGAMLVAHNGVDPKAHGRRCVGHWATAEV